MDCESEKLKKTTIPPAKARPRKKHQRRDEKKLDHERTKIGGSLHPLLKSLGDEFLSGPRKSGTQIHTIRGKRW